MKALLILLIFIGSGQLHAQIEGDWYSSFVVVGKSLSLHMEVESDSSEIDVFLTDLDSTFVRQKMSNAKFESNEFYFKWKAINLWFEGKFDSKKNEISGIMTQNDVKWEATFSRNLQAEKSVNRPQMPGDQSGYLTTEEIEIQSGEVTLSGTLTLPKNFNDATKIVVLASGSGPQNRDCELMGHKPFLVIADRLAKKGIATLRFDDRGTAKSSGSYNAASLMDFGSDVTSWVDTLQNRYPENKIGVAGHSEGGMHALIAATSTKNVAFVIELASVGTTGKDVLVDQQYSIPKQEGKSEEYCDWNSAVFAGGVDIIQTFDRESAQDTLGSFFKAMYEKAPKEYQEKTPKFTFVTGLVMFFNNEWARQFSAFETRDYLKKLKIPMLILNGEKDVQVPAEKNQAGFKKGMTCKTKRKSTLQVVEGVNHLFQTCVKCDIMEYADLEETFSESTLELISNWILEQ